MVDLIWISGGAPAEPMRGCSAATSAGREQAILDNLIGAERALNPYRYGSTASEEWARAYYFEQRDLCDAGRWL